MIVYTDLVSGDQVLSDSFSQSPLTYNGEALEGLVMVQSKMMVKGAVEIDTGANASAEGGEDGGEDGAAAKVNNLCDADSGFGYEGPMTLTKQEFGTMFKAWCKKTKDKILEKGDKPKPFMQSAQKFLTFLNSEFKNFEIYQTSSFSAFVVGWWDDEGNTIGAPKFSECFLLSGIGRLFHSESEEKRRGLTSD